MLMQYQNFYRSFGIRLFSQMEKPPIPLLQKLNIPRNAIYHYIGVGSLDPGPTQSENILKNVNKTMFIETVSELSEPHLGKPRRQVMDIERVARIHRINNPNFRPARAIEQSTRDPETPLVINYAYMHRLYKYQRSVYTAYYRWHNVLTRVIEKMAELAKVSDRQQFVEFTMPTVIPSVSQLRTAERGLNQQTAPIFSIAETIIQLELWKWFGENRKTSIFSKFSRSDLDKINLIFRDGGRWTCLNLGVAESFRIPTREELKENPELERRGAVQADRMDRVVLRLAVLLTKNRSNPAADENLGDEVVESDLDKVIKQALPTPEQAEEADPKDFDHERLDIEDEAIPQSSESEAADRAIEAETGELSEDLDKIHRFDAQVDDDLEALELIEPPTISSTNFDREDVPVVVEARTYESAIIEHANKLADAGALAASDYRSYLEQAGAYKNLPAPDGTPLGTFVEVPHEVVKIKQQNQIPDTPTVTDKSMLHSSLLEFDERYVEQVLERDIASMVVSMQNAGVIVKSYEREEVETIAGTVVHYQVRVKPLVGQASTLDFRIPKVQPNGQYRFNGVNYRTRKQRGEMPIRKIAPARVALTSYYGKLFVERSDKKVNDYGRWLRDKIMAIGLDQSNDIVTDMVTADVFDNLTPTPRLYSIIAHGFRMFTLKVGETKFRMNFDTRARDSIAPSSIRDSLEEDGRILVGKADDGSYMVMGFSGELYRAAVGQDGEAVLQPQAALDEILGIRVIGAPLEYADLVVFSKRIPLGVVLGYLFGLDKLVRRLGVVPRIVPTGQRAGIRPDEWAMVFQDEAWIFSRDDQLASLVLGGWRDYFKTTQNYSAHEFNRQDVYANALEDQKLGNRYLRELDLLDQMFIDPIAKQLLELMKEPVVFQELLLRAAELLVTDQHPHELDARYLRIKGYERFAGLLYGELVKAIRIHNSKAGKANQSIDLPPYAVWTEISKDPAKDQCVEINPVKNLKELEAVTYSGTGGRSGRSMVKRTRAYHESDLGIMSEATSDSSDVGINTFLSANPKFNSLRGTADPFVIGESGASSALSTSALLAPASDRDDGKRVNFISIQNAHGVACEGYHQPQVRTGYEAVIAHRTDDLYATTAKFKGTVTSLTGDGIIVTYENGKTVAVELGKRYGHAAGLIIPHEVKTPLTLGDTVEPGDPIAYNSGFFEIDALNPKQIIYKTNMSVKTVLLESPDTLEDSSAISDRLSKMLNTRVTKVRNIMVNFDQNLHRMVKVGDQLEYESILCVIEDAVSSRSSGLSLDSQSLDALRILMNAVPTAKMRGVVERIEVYYNGDKEDMNPGLRALADISDREISSRNRSMGKKAYTGSVDENFRVENEPLLLDTAVIRVYISTTVPAGVGDKGVFANQLKTVIGRVIEGGLKTESGVQVDAVFGAASVDDRIVTSPFIIGTTATLLNVIAERAVKLYKS